MKVLAAIHRRTAFGRRSRVLAEAIGPLLPGNASVLDVGCGDGTIGRLLEQRRPDLRLVGIEVARRRDAGPMVEIFDGLLLPYRGKSVDAVMFVDVLHHSSDPDQLLRESARVARQAVIIKDHLCENLVDDATLRFMDWVGNRPYGVSLACAYRSKRAWQVAFDAAGLEVRTWQTGLNLYPGPARLIFGRTLHLLTKLTPSV